MTRAQKRPSASEEVKGLVGDAKAGGRLLFAGFAVEVLVDHLGHAAVRPDVFGRFQHVEHRVEGENDAHEKNRDVHARQEARRKEEAAHRNARVPDGGDGRDENPARKRADRDFGAGVLHEIDAGDEDEGGAGVHVDRRADRKDEARDALANAHVLFGTAHRDGKRSGGRLREEGDGQGRQHRAEGLHGGDPLHEEDRRQDHEDLQEVRRDDRREVGPETAQGNARLQVAAEHRDEAEDPEGKDFDEPGNEDEEDLLRPREEGRENFLRARILFKMRESETDGTRDQKDRNHVGRQEGREEVVGNYRLHVLKVGVLDHLGDVSRLRRKRHVGRRVEKEERGRHGRGDDRRKERVEDRAPEDLARLAAFAQLCEGRDERDRDDGDADELEESDEDGRETFTVEQVNTDGSTSTFKVTLGDNNRVMSEVKTIDRNGNGKSFATDGIVQRKSYISVQKNTDGSKITVVEDRFAFSQTYSSRTIRPLFSDGTTADGIPADEIMFTKEDMNKFATQVAKQGNKAYTFKEFG